MRRMRNGLVMVAGEPGSVPAAAHSALCLQMPSLAVSKTLGAHARIQAFRRLRARFLNERAGPGAGCREDFILEILILRTRSHLRAAHPVGRAHTAHWRDKLDESRGVPSTSMGIVEQAAMNAGLHCRFL